MNISRLVAAAKLFTKTNSPEILTGLAAGGVAVTAYLTAKATVKAVRHVDAHDKATAPLPEYDTKMERYKTNVKMTWKFYIPPAVAGTATIACVLGSNKTAAKRTLAAVSAYSLTERAFTEYKEGVIKEFGPGKDQKIRDKITEEAITKNPPKASNVVVTGHGDHLCYEGYTGRYFYSSMETLKKAQNDLNKMIINNDYAFLSDFYDLINLDHTSTCTEVGWTVSNLMELEFGTHMAEGGVPCIVFVYNYVKPLT